MTAKQIHVLLAEDDRYLGNLLKNYLEAKGYVTTLCLDGGDALATFREKKFDFCILDIMMPAKDGFTVAREIREKHPKIPILFLTAKSLQEDKVKGFKAGADDYLTKPFSMEELLLRMQAILRRTAGTTETPVEGHLFSIGAYTFDDARQTLTLRGNERRLTSRESALLRLLCLHMNDVLPRTKALTEIWNSDSYFNARSMDVYVVKLRKYLKEDPGVELINVHGVGFKLITAQ